MLKSVSGRMYSSIEEPFQRFHWRVIMVFTPSMVTPASESLSLMNLRLLSVSLNFLPEVSLRN